jgi:hypothetical protein
MAVNERTGLETPFDLAPYEIDEVEDVREALQRAVAGSTRVIVAPDGEPVAAVIPMDDLYLLLRLEDAELDRIDLEEIRKAEAEPGGRAFIPWAQVKSDVDL